MLPRWIDPSNDEKLAAAIIRGPVSDYSPWGKLIASAQATMSLFYEHFIDSPAELYDEANAVPLIAASRVLDSAAQPFSGVPDEHRNDLALTAAVAFGMYGNFLSARTVIRVLNDRTKGRALSPSQAAIIGTAAPNFIPGMIPRCPSNSPERAYLESLNAFLRSGSEPSLDELSTLLAGCIVNAATPFEQALLRPCVLCLKHITNLSIAKVFAESLPSLPDDYLQSLLDQNIRFFQPPQHKAIVTHHVVTRRENAIISLHTSTGKTLLGELSLVAALNNEPGAVCYLAPYVALGRQIANTFKDHLPERFRVRSMIGGYRESEPLDFQSSMEVIVATPERFDGLMRANPTLAQSLRCVVVDEAHLVQNATRGVCLEGIVTRLLLLRRRGFPIRIVLLSAVLSEYDNLSSWIDAPANLVVTDPWKPTARRVAIWRQSGDLTWYVGDDPVRHAGITNESVVCSMKLPWPETSFYPAKNFGQERQQAWKAAKNIAFLSELLFERYQEPILCYCSTKDSTRDIANALGERFKSYEAIPAAVSAAIEVIQSNHTFLLPLAELLKRGVAYHNASLPHDVRRSIEDAVRNRQLRAVAATTTLAEGVDLPFRFTVVVDWITWQGDRKRPIPSTLFKNIAGRCGRAGMLTEGDTIVFDNPLGDPAIVYSYNRDRTLKDVILKGQSEPLASALSQAQPGTDYETSLKAILASQFVASIPENPDVDDLKTEFGQHLYWAQQTPSARRIAATMSGVEASILDEERWALARAASPLHLTPFGEVSMRSGFSPDSSRQITKVLQEMTSEFDEDQLANQLLLLLGSLPEQSSNKLRKELEKESTRSRVRKDDLPYVLRSWKAGQPPEVIFANLPSVRRSSITPNIDIWLSGSASMSKWDSEFDSFMDIHKSAIVEFLPWVLRACNTFKTLIGGWTLDVDWEFLACYYEYGVDTRWAVNAHRADAPASRVALTLIGRIWPSQYVDGLDPLGLNALKEADFFRQIETAFKRLIADHGESSPISSELARLRGWLMK